MGTAARVADATGGQPVVKVSAEQRAQIEAANRALLQEALFTKQLEFQAGPYEAHVQFSNFCNMSCIMCWDGANPPLKNIAPEVLARFSEQVGPHLSLVTPYSASEPLAVNWDEITRFARTYSVDLCLTTNVQYLDEQKFYELADITETLFLSIDSHIPEVFAHIRPGSRPDLVFANLTTTAKLAREHGLECIVNVVFMTQNAPLLPETIAYLADIEIEAVHVIQLLDVNGRSSFSDPLLHFSAEYVEQIKQRCIDVARARRIRLHWDVGSPENYDFRDEMIGPRQRKVAYDRWDWKMKMHLPGFCRQAYDRLQVDADGDVAPCCYSTDGELRLGNIREQDFEQIWNGPTAQDLRRAMYTWDYPSLCASCRLKDPVPPQHWLPFIDGHLDQAIGIHPEHGPRVIELQSPEHASRHTEPPRFGFRMHDAEVDSFLLVVSLGGDHEQIEICEIGSAEGTGETIEFELPVEVWERLETNRGYWWTIVGLAPSFEGGGVRSDLRCVIRHEPMARLAGSGLEYPDQGRLAVADLGGTKQAGWTDPGTLPQRPNLGERRRLRASQRALRRTRRALRRLSEDAGGRKLTREEYEQVVARLHAIARSALRDDATVLVVSKGDDALVALQHHRGRHFPCDGDGAYSWHHPADGDDAVARLEALRADGATYLAFPTSAFWWFASYPELARHLAERYPMIVDDESCVIFDLRWEA